MPEVTESEYRAKERQRDACQRKLNTCNNKILSLDDEINDLDRAIRNMRAVYSEFKAQVNTMEDVFGEKYDFTGNQQKTLMVKDGDSLVAEAKRCQHDVNDALDQLEWLRLEKSKQRNKQYGLLGEIKSQLSSIWTWLDTNFFNN